MYKGSTRFGLGLYGVSLAVLLLRFLVPRPVGMADNGDGWRLLCQLGGNGSDRPLEDVVRFVYPPVQSCRSDYVSSQLWLDTLAQRIGHLLGDNAALNLIVVGVLCSVIAAAGVTFVALGLPLSRPQQATFAALLLLLVADSAFFGYFASVLSESAAFLGILLLVAGLLLIQRTGRWRYLGLALTLSGALIGANAKAQTLLLLPVLGLALLLMRKHGRGIVARWALPVVAMVLATGGTVAVQLSGNPAGDEWREANAYHAIFHNILDGDHDTEADLAYLGLPPSYARYIGTEWWGPVVAKRDPTYPEYRAQISRRNVARYYLEHPGRTVEILHEGARDLLTARPDNLGSFGEDAGMPPKAQEYRVPVWSGLLGLVAPLGLFFLVPVWALVAAGALRAWRARRDLAVVTLFVLGSALGQFLVAALGEGIEGVKHQVIALFCTVLAVIMAGATWTATRKRAEPDDTVSRDVRAGMTMVE
ncbi:hypothetical protein [Amycolatopsis cihanbeyliensis]|uniref:Dolichyl-phosphate-mannose-protein mannosyltransferase n=1 Tax=Amycolatopsis cihanbeyliensis TaxID=1128664 RepID=A0A542DGJ8_AMYCI|nr:hypothetical protein [Amycolatopsis cihanbeyliensis]TQJ02196.1 hypothetical protein FB471_1915 [Amycolatopsis cihanbeyliensis]